MIERVHIAPLLWKKLGRTDAVPQPNDVDTMSAALMDLVDANTRALASSRFLFALAVECTECWILALLTGDGTRTSGCLEATNDALKAMGAPPLNRDGDEKKSKDFDRYRDLSLPLQERLRLKGCADANTSLRRFVDHLERVPPTTPTSPNAP